MVLLVAYATGKDALAEYTHPCSPKKFTQPQLFACLVLKTFLRTDYRGLAKFLDDLPDLRRTIDLKHTPHFTTFQKAAHRLLRHPHIGRLLDTTVRRAMGRTRRVDLAAVDSTGLEAHHVSRYFITRRSREPGLWQTTTYRRFPKLAVVCDCLRHVVLSFYTARGPTPDVHQLRRTLTPATRRVRITHLLADAGYDSEANHCFARHDCGIRTTIPPKYGRPTTKLPTTHYRRLMKQRFDTAAYGQRWQVETVFSAIKRRLGSSLRGRTYHSQNRDMALMVLTYNIMLIWHAMKGFLQSMSGLLIDARQSVVRGESYCHPRKLL